MAGSFPPRYSPSSDCKAAPACRILIPDVVRAAVRRAWKLHLSLRQRREQAVAEVQSPGGEGNRRIGGAGDGHAAFERPRKPRQREEIEYPMVPGRQVDDIPGTGRDCPACGSNGDPQTDCSVRGISQSHAQVVIGIARVEVRGPGSRRGHVPEGSPVARSLKKNRPRDGSTGRREPPTGIRRGGCPGAGEGAASSRGDGQVDLREEASAKVEQQRVPTVAVEVDSDVGGIRRVRIREDEGDLPPLVDWSAIHQMREYERGGCRRRVRVLAACRQGGQNNKQEDDRAHRAPVCFQVVCPPKGLL